MSKHKNHINVKDGNEKAEKNEKAGLTEDGSPESADSEVQKLRELLQRKVAEFENYRRRTENDLINSTAYGIEKVIKELLPVYDDLQRSIESVDKGQTKDFETLKTGIKLIYDKFRGVLEKEGLTEINTVGKPFDVELSTALMQIPKEDLPPHTVIESFEKGYKLNGKVIRHEKVMVSSEPELPAHNEDK
ncbi:MAG: nucleotide exchange factor GrpE [Ignavibacteria bacterium]|nr:nucleotide exchange factor GrpE [Ignavibacteria bacterium]